MKNSKTLAQWISLFLLGFSLIVVYKMFDSLAEIGGGIGKLFSILTPFVIGFVIAFLLYPPVNRLEGFFKRRKWKFWHKAGRPLAVVIVYLLALGLVALLVYLAVPALFNALVDFINNIPVYYNKVMEILQPYIAPGGLLDDFDVKAKVQEVYAALQAHLTVDRILSYVKGVVNATSSLVNVVMALIVSVYMLLGRESLMRAVRAVCGLFIREKSLVFISGYLSKISKIFYSYVYSQLLDASVVSILATIGFLLARLPNAFALGVMLGLMNMIPYFGALIGGVICVLVALLTGNFYGALFVAIYIVVMQQVDANIIQPRIVGQTVGLKAIYVLLGITVCGGLFGFWGILLGAPMMAVIQLILTEIIAARKKAVPSASDHPEE